ncbi:MAG: hypothetical protein OHK0032_06590 [Thermodesulfovibrionales bacterium]
MERKSILLVEDDADVRDIIRFVLERNYNVLEASRYSEAIGYLSKPLDLALIDYILPDHDGFELLKAIRKVKPTLPAIIMTAYSNETVAIKAVRAGATDYIKKPLSLISLMRKVSEILGEKIDTGHREDETVESRDEFIMDGIATYIEEKYMEGLTLDKLAAMAGMNKFRLCRAFKGRFGQTFKSYLNSVRIKNAAELLKSPDLSISEIAYIAGYGSIVHFERIFKERYGISPVEYRRKRSKGD